MYYHIEEGVYPINAEGKIPVDISSIKTSKMLFEYPVCFMSEMQNINSISDISPEFLTLFLMDYKYKVTETFKYTYVYKCIWKPLSE